MLNDAHCHFFSPRFFDDARDAEGAAAERRRAGADRRSSSGRRPGAPAVLADRWRRRAGPASGGTRGAHRQRARRRRVGGDRGGASSDAVRRLLHDRSDGGRRARRGSPRRSRKPGMRVRVPLPRHAPLRALRRARAARRRTCWRVSRARRCSCTAACLSVGVRKKLGLPSRFEMRFGNPLAPAARRHDVPGAADHRAALRRRHVPRGADARRRLSERLSGHVQLERLDEISPRADASDRLSSGPRRRRPRPAALRHRLVVLPARLAARHPRPAAQRRSRHWASMRA